MEAIEEKRIGDYLIKIFPDNNPENPRNWDNLTKMVCFHNHYSLGDKHDYNHGDYNGWDEMEADIIRNEKPVVIKPLYLYDHSGITMNTTGFSCPWDSGRVGFVFVTRKDALKEYGKKRITPAIKEKAEKVLDGEVETYDQFLTGDVYGYKIFKGEEELDSCWGFYGLSEAIDEATAIVENEIKNDAEVLETSLNTTIQ